MWAISLDVAIVFRLCTSQVAALDDNSIARIERRLYVTIITTPAKSSVCKPDQGHAVEQLQQPAECCCSQAVMPSSKPAYGCSSTTIPV